MLHRWWVGRKLGEYVRGRDAVEKCHVAHVTDRQKKARNQKQPQPFSAFFSSNQNLPKPVLPFGEKCHMRALPVCLSRVGGAMPGGLPVGMLLSPPKQLGLSSPRPFSSMSPPPCHCPKCTKQRSFSLTGNAMFWVGGRIGEEREKVFLSQPIRHTSHKACQHKEWSPCWENRNAFCREN